MIIKVNFYNCFGDYFFQTTALKDEVQEWGKKQLILIQDTLNGVESCNQDDDTRQVLAEFATNTIGMSYAPADIDIYEIKANYDEDTDEWTITVDLEVPNDWEYDYELEKTIPCN